MEWLLANSDNPTLDDPLSESDEVIIQWRRLAVLKIFFDNISLWRVVVLSTKIVLDLSRS